MAIMTPTNGVYFVGLRVRTASMAERESRRSDNRMPPRATVTAVHDGPTSTTTAALAAEAAAKAGDLVGRAVPARADRGELVVAVSAVMEFVILTERAFAISG